MLQRLKTYKDKMSVGKGPGFAGMARLLSIGGFSLAMVFTLLALQALEGQWTWMASVRQHLSRHVPQVSAEMLPIPVAFLFWIRLMERMGGKIPLAFSPVSAALSAAALVVAQEFQRYSELRQNFFALGVVAGLFILAPFKECVMRAIREPRPALVAVMAATAAYDYYVLMDTAWMYIGNWTTHASYLLLRMFGANVTIGTYTNGSPTIASRYFIAIINPGCNGLEGIFLFTFMLSVMLLLDWDLFKRRVILLLYEFGIVYMFLFNILRIATLCAISYWAYNPAAWGWVQALRGLPTYMFHSYLGWIYYLVAFGIFSKYLYNSAATPEIRGK